jgi:NAD(P)H-dependent flavin oxidoreductase YrpB (nitropropane dioxygenase family)
MHTEVCKLFGIDLPIFAFSHCRDVVVAVSKAGGMGVLGAVDFSPEQLEIELRWIDQHIEGKPYGVDIVMPASYVGRADAAEGSKAIDRKFYEDMIPEAHVQFVEKILKEYAVPALPDSVESVDRLLNWTEGGGRGQIEVALRHPIQLLVNALGPPPKDVIETAHERGLKVAALVGSVKHALRQKAQGVDIIVAQGTEAGGHTGEIASMVLIPEVVDAVAPTPVLAAGGIGSGRQAAAALALGAQGVWTGSIWLTVEESDIIPELKDKFYAAGPEDAVRSRSMSGKPARMLKTPWTEAWVAEGSPGTLPLPLQLILSSRALERVTHWAHSDKTRAKELLGTAVGQIVGRMKSASSSREVIYEFVDEFVDTVGRLNALLDDVGHDN